MNSKKAFMSALLSASALAALSTSAYAQSSPSGGGVAMLDEVVVTARKREESLQEVPVAVTAFSAESLREKNITSSYDVPLHTPGLTVRSANSQRGSADFFIRGQGSTFGSGPGVVAYFAEAPTFDTIVGNVLNFYDIASVQVLKGPQGTLFGRSTTGGAVLVEPQRPTNEFEGFLEGKVGNLDYREITAAINVPVIEDKLMVRLAANILRREGYTISSTTGQDLDDQHRDSFRVGVTFRPTDWLETYTLYHVTDINENATGAVLLNFNDLIPQFNTGPTGVGRLAVTGLCAQINPGPLAGNIPSCIATRVARIDALRNQLQAEENRTRAGGDDAIRSTPTDQEWYQQVRTEVLQNITTLSFDDTPLGDIEIKNIFATQHFTDAASQRGIVGAAFPHGTTTNGAEIIGNQTVVTDRSGSNDWGDRYSNEFQVSGSTTMLDWIVGYYFEQSHRDLGFGPVFPSFNNAFSVPLDALSYLTPISLNSHSEFTGIFGQATVRLDALVSGLAITGGYRRSTAESTGFTAPPILSATQPVGIGAVRTPTQPIDEEVDTFNVSVDWKVTPDLLLYATHRKGYKPGGRNVLPANPVPGSRATFDPEILKDIELGAKYTWSTDMLRGRSNLAVYNQEYTDIQRNQILVNPAPPFGTQTQVNNIAGATLYGLELENLLQIGERWTLTANYAYTHAEYDEYPGFTTNILGVAIPNIQSPYPGTPEHQVTLGVRYLAVESEEMGDIALSADFYYQSEVELDDQSLTDPARTGLQEGWSNVNLRADWTNVMGRPVDAALFVRNVTDDVHLLGAGNLINNLGSLTGIFSEPRTYGLELRWRFGGSE